MSWRLLVVASNGEFDEAKAKKILDTLEGSGYCLEIRDGELMLGDTCYRQGEIEWEPTTIDELIDICIQLEDDWEDE